MCLGRTYFYNKKTKQKQWEKPAEMDSKKSDSMAQVAEAQHAAHLAHAWVEKKHPKSGTGLPRRSACATLLHT